MANIANAADPMYLGFLKEILESGNQNRQDRTGTGTISKFGMEMRFDLSQGFPLLTTKKVYWRGVVVELLWFLSGNTNIKELQEQKVKIWDEWADKNGDLGPVYGYQWRNWPGTDGKIFDQITELEHNLKNDPYSRRHIISAWNVAQLQEMALMPCHLLYQFYIHDNKLSCKWIQRSADAFLGVPFNIASYALLTHMLARVCDLEVGELIFSGGDCHIYNNHVDQVNEQLTRSPLPLANLKLPQRDSIIDYTLEDILAALDNYESHGTISAPISA